MKWLVLTVGKPALAYARAGRDEYVQRISRHAAVTQRTVKAADPAKEGRDLLAASEGCFRLVLDGRGKAPASRQLAREMETWMLRGRTVALMIGGADGHSAEVLEQADFTWSLGPATLQHELALVVALEQIYRAHTILAGHPYHRE